MFIQKDRILCRDIIMNDSTPLKIKWKASLWSLFLAISIVICFLGESFISYEKNKKDDFKEAERIIFSKINELEKLIDSDLARILNFGTLIFDKKNIIKLNENSDFNFFIKSNPHTHSLCIALLIGKEKHIYNKHGLIQEKFVPKEIIERCYFEIDKFKIFYKNEKLYFAKGFFYEENIPCILFISQDLKEFVKHAGLKNVDLGLKNKSDSFVVDPGEFLNYLDLIYTDSWGNFFLCNRLGFLFCCLFFVGVGLGAFILNVLKLTKLINEKNRSQYEEVLKKISASHIKVEKLQQENLILQKKYSDQESSNRGKERIFKKIFPFSKEFLKGLQPLQEALIIKCKDKEIEEALGKFSETLKQLELHPRLVKLSFSKTVQEVIMSFSEELAENNIKISIKGRDFLIYGELSVLYYLVYFILKECILRVPPNGLIKLKLETRLNISKLMIEDNGFILSENYLKELDSISSRYEKDFLVDPAQGNLMKIAHSLGWSIVRGEKKGPFNITEIIIKNSLETETKNYSNLNIINLFKSK
ncbi:MAG: hypothetical protein JSS34_00225 [Proteobacteria bacterium]|nr:hypothetical protein [Pseudomonadota bacterium]